MHSSHARPRRHERLDDDELYAVSRGGDRRSESFSRSNHYSSRAESYGGSSATQRGYADTSRSRRSEDWRNIEVGYTAPTHDRYDRDDVVAPPRREEYHERSDGWGSRLIEDSQYSSTRRESSKRDDHNYAPYSGGRSWSRASRYEEIDRRIPANGGWTRDDARHDRGPEVYSRDEPFSTRDRGLGVLDDVVAVESVRDRRPSNWAERTNECPHWRREDRERDRDIPDEPERSFRDVDRKWEPAAAWKSGERDERIVARYDRPDPPQPFSRTIKKPGKNKKKGQHGFQKRDAKKDDSMNNWQRRDLHSAQRGKDIGKTATGKRRHVHSTDSRSLSPARSSYSRRSSNRSRSRSLSPKRRKRTEEGLNWPLASPNRKGPTHRSRSPSWSPKWVPSPAEKSRRTDEARGRSRRSNSSSRSSQSRSRSRSSTEGHDVMPKPKHRLPTATSLRDIEMQAKSLRLATPVRQPADVNSGPPGRTGAKQGLQSSSKSPGKSRDSEKVRNHRDGYESMPPPANPASASANGTVVTVHSTSTVIVDTQSKAAKRNAGFKPIGFVQNNAAMKRFFPGEDDELEANVEQEARQTNRVTPERSPASDSFRNSRQRQDWKMQSPRQSERDADIRQSRAGRSQCPPSRNGGAGHRDSSIEPRRRREEPSLRASTNRHHIVQTSTHGDDLPSESPRRGPSSRNGEPHVNGKDYKKEQLPPDRADSILPLPERRQSEDEQLVESVPETPKDQVYAIVSQVGEGTFGKVYKAKNTVTGVHVALKRIRMETERDGFPVTAMREIKLLQSLRHVNIVQLMEMMVHHGSVYMVFEYMDHDLTGVLSQTQFSFSDAHLKSLCQQMLQGLSYLHRKGVIHRDIKGSNILLNNRGELKLGDFGLARFYQKRRRSDYTNRVITLWYRPPELLLGTTVYGPEVDMWSAGCIMLELFCKKPVFQGNDEIHQLDVVYKILGTPTPEVWPSVTDMPWYELVKPKEVLRNRFRELFNKWLSPAALDLAERLLSYDPLQRVTADQALEASYFSQEEPPPILPIGLASLEGEWHEFESKRERAKKRRKIEAISADPAIIPPQ